MSFGGWVSGFDDLEKVAVQLVVVDHLLEDLFLLPNLLSKKYQEILYWIS